MMDLILWRHAEAHDARPGESDLDRALTARGERQAQRMAEWLNRHLPSSTHVLASPALRTQQTARALGRHFDTVAELRPGADVKAVLSAARWPNADKAVLVVGHQPTLGMVAAQLLAGEPQDWVIRKGAVWWLRGNGNGDGNGPSDVVLLAVQSADLL